jgi:hypothetical protein
MSNNPFLQKTNSSNNRFRFLDLDTDLHDTYDSKPKKNHKVNTSSTLINDDKKANVFLNDKPYIRSNYNNMNRNMYTKRYSNDSKIYEKKKEPIQFNIDNNLFPDLINEGTNKPAKTENRLCFKEAIHFVKKDEPKEQNNIRPGCVELSFSGRKIVSNRGPLTASEIKHKQQCIMENDPIYIMHTAVENMKINWERNIKIYDMISGEGAYERDFASQPVYGPEYDSESDSDDNYEDSDEELYS